MTDERVVVMTAKNTTPDSVGAQRAINELAQKIDLRFIAHEGFLVRMCEDIAAQYDIELSDVYKRVLNKVTVVSTPQEEHPSARRSIYTALQELAGQL